MDVEPIEKKEDDFDENNIILDEEIILNFTLTNCQKDLYYKIEMVNHNNSLGNFELFETEQILCTKDNSEIKFKKTLTCTYSFYKKQIVFLRIKKAMLLNNSLIDKKYERLTVLSSLVASDNSLYERYLKEDDNNSEMLHVQLIKKVNYPKNLSLFEFLKSGIKLSCYISLDFSKGNEYNQDDDSYFNILKGITSLISNYIIDRRSFYVYGIGGKPNNYNNSQNFFNINMDEDDTSIKPYNKIVEYYEKCLENIEPDNKINLSSLIEKVNIDIYNKSELGYYNILFILLKDIVDTNDIENIYDRIIESSYLPVSIIIIGIGKTDFTQMNKIFNSIPQVSYTTGTKKKRDNTIFISMNDDFENNTEIITQICFKNIGKQFLNYYELNECTPEDIKLKQYESVKNSFSLFNNSVNKSQYLNNIYKNNQTADNEKKNINDQSSNNLKCPSPESNKIKLSTNIDFGIGKNISTNLFNFDTNLNENVLDKNIQNNEININEPIKQNDDQKNNNKKDEDNKLNNFNIIMNNNNMNNNENNNKVNNNNNNNNKNNNMRVIKSSTNKDNGSYKNPYCKEYKKDDEEPKTDYNQYDTVNNSNLYNQYNKNKVSEKYVSKNLFGSSQITSTYYSETVKGSNMPFP